MREGTVPRQLDERREAGDLLLATQLEDLVRQLGTDPGLDQLFAAGGVRVHFGHRFLPQFPWLGYRHGGT